MREYNCLKCKFTLLALTWSFDTQLYSELIYKNLKMNKKLEIGDLFSTRNGEVLISSKSTAFDFVDVMKQQRRAIKQRESSLSYVLSLIALAEICCYVEDAHNYFRGGVLYLHMQYA